MIREPSCRPCVRPPRRTPQHTPWVHTTSGRPLDRTSSRQRHHAVKFVGTELPGLPGPRLFAAIRCDWADHAAHTEIRQPCTPKAAAGEQGVGDEGLGRASPANGQRTQQQPGDRPLLDRRRPARPRGRPARRDAEPVRQSIHGIAGAVHSCICMGRHDQQGLCSVRRLAGGARECPLPYDRRRQQAVGVRLCLLYLLPSTSKYRAIPTMSTRLRTSGIAPHVA